MDFRVLGPLEVVDGENRPVRLPGSRTRALLAELIVHANRVVSAHQLVEALWGDSPPETAAKTLQTYVLQVRRAIEPARERGTTGDLVLTKDSGYMLAVDPDQIDAVRFERLVEQGRDALRASAPDQAADVLSKALALWRGPALDDVGSPAYFQPEAVRLGELRLAALEDRAEAELALGRHVELIADLERALADHPLRERLWGQLILALYRSGRQADALRAFQRARERLVEDIGVEPGPELRRLEAGVLAQDPALDLDFAPSAPSLPPALTAMAGVFVDRHDELAKLLSAWDQATAGDGQLVVVLGGDGMGKSRLLAELAQRAHAAGGLVLYGRASGPTPALHPFTEAMAGVGASLEVVTGNVADATSEQLAGALVAFLRRRSGARPALLALDDLHRADERSLELLLALRGAVTGTRVLVVGTCAPDHRAAEGALTGATDSVLRLPPLDRSDMEAIAAHYLGPETISSLTSLLAAANGSPLIAHREAARIARSLAARRIGAASDRAVGARGSLQDVQREIVGGVLELQRLRSEGGSNTEDAATPLPSIWAPYKGLTPFEASDAGYFFGREHLVAETVAAVVGSSFLAIVGPSGGGKSSLARAGLLPALRDGVLPGADRWAQLVMSPGAHPVRELLRRLGATESEVVHAGAVAEALDNACATLPAGGGLLLFIDQFEEVFTTCRDFGERAAFLDALVTSSQRHTAAITVLVALRSDYYGGCSAHPEFAALVAANNLLVGPMTEVELRRAIELPARRAGGSAGPGFADALVADFAGEPGALPLLSTALLEAWEHREGTTMSLGGYRRRGGLHTAIARLAESAFSSLDAAQQATARRILLRLAGDDDSGGFVRRRVGAAELAATGPEAEPVLGLLTNRRLLTSHDGVVEVAHEALLREWPRLRAWLHEDRHRRSVRDHLHRSARDWVEGGRDENELYRGSRLAMAIELANDGGEHLAEDEAAFLAASTAAAERQTQEVLQRAQEQARANRRLRVLVSGLVVVLTVALVAGGLAVVERGRADREARRAEARRVAAESVPDNNLDRALLLARAASDRDPSAATTSSLLANLARSPQAVGIFRIPDRAQHVAISPDGNLLAIPDNFGRTYLWDTRSRRQVGEPLSVSDPLTAGAAFSADGKTLFASTGIRGQTNAAVVVWEVTGRQPTGERLEGFPAYAGRVAISADGRVLAASGIGATRVWSLADEGRPGVTLSSGQHQQSLFAGLSADGRILVTSYPDGAAQVWDVPGRALIREFEDSPDAVAVNPAGTTVAVAARNGTVSLHDVATGERRQVLASHKDQLFDLRFSADGALLVSASDDRTAIVWDVESGARRDTLVGHHGRVMGAVFSPDGKRVYTASLDGTAMIWDLSGAERFGERIAPSTRTSPPRAKALHVPALAISPDGDLAATTPYDGTVQLRRLPGGTPIGPPLPGTSKGLVNRLSFSPDGTLLAGAGDDGTAIIWDVAAQRVMTKLEGVHEEPVYTVAWSPDGRTLATGGVDGVVVLWDRETGGTDGTVLRVVPEPPTGEEEEGGPWGQLLPKTHPGIVNQLVFSPNGRWLVAAVATPDRGEAMVWELPSRALRHRLPGDSLRVLTVAVSPDSEVVASGGREGKVRLWNVSDGRPTGGPMEGDGDIIHGSAFSPDGSVVATVGPDGAPALWDVESRRRLGAPLPGPTELGNAQAEVTFADGGRQVVALFQDGQAWRWDADLESWRARACSVAGRNLSRPEWEALLPGQPHREICPEWPRRRA